MNQTGFYMIDVLKMFHESWLTKSPWPSWDVTTNLEYANIHIIFLIHPFTSHYNTAHILWILALSSSPGTLLIWLVWHNTNLDTFNPTLLKYVGHITSTILTVSEMSQFGSNYKQNYRRNK